MPPTLAPVADEAGDLDHASGQAVACAGDVHAVASSLGMFANALSQIS